MFNIRVYGILINNNDEILIAEELIKDQYITKFCGGGLEHGEGTLACLKREFIEEMNLNIEVLEHLYTTDFYQQSAFNPTQQIISIYYLVKALEPIKIKLNEKPFDFDEWLMSRIKTCIETMNLLYENHDKYLIERARILCEVCYLLNEYFNDIFLDIEKNHIHNIALRLKEWVKEITNAMVNTNNFTLEEKSFLGNTRRDIDLLYIRLLNI
jgi:ADP-ribose pyrophosphatase YjhB (NUDIX family)